MIITFLVECDICKKKINAIYETYCIKDDLDLCNKCNEDY